jgi:hypothetical protein
MRSRRDGCAFGLVLAGALVVVGTLVVLAPVADASCSVGPAPYRCTAATATDKSPEKRIFVFCPAGTKATGGGAQVFSTLFKETIEPGQRGKISITQSVPTQNLTGYAARAQAENGFKYPWHLTAYAICQ